MRRFSRDSGAGLNPAGRFFHRPLRTDEPRSDSADEIGAQLAKLPHSDKPVLYPGGVPDETYERLKAKLTPPQIVDLACVLGFWKMYNTIHEVFSQ
jgi:hypothetical protein